MLALVPDVKGRQHADVHLSPGKGTTVQVGDRGQGVFEERGFADAVFSIRLGSRPPSEDLRKGMSE